MHIGIIGLNHKLADLKLRELFAKACQRLFGSEPGVFRNHASVLLTTCNRTELYFSSTDLADTHIDILNALRYALAHEAFDQKVYTYFGSDCFHHLARVTSGLDSAIVAETEIQGQVKQAYEASMQHQVLPHELHFLFQKVLKIGKQVRTQLRMGRSLPDLEHAIFNTGKHMFSSPDGVRVLFVGASEINRKIICFFKQKGIGDLTLSNRSPLQAEAFAKKYGMEQLDWKDIDAWHTFDWIIFGTKASEHLIEKEALPTDSFNQKLVMDLSVPRNVDPRISRDPRVTLLNIDQLNRMLKVRHKQMTHLLSKAEEVVGSSTTRQVELFHEKCAKRTCLVAI